MHPWVHDTIIQLMAARQWTYRGHTCDQLSMATSFCYLTDVRWQQSAAFWTERALNRLGICTTEHSQPFHYCTLSCCTIEQNFCSLRARSELFSCSMLPAVCHEPVSRHNQLQSLSVEVYISASRGALSDKAHPNWLL